MIKRIASQRIASQPPAAHPLAELFPVLGGDALNQLARSVARHGLREPITLYEGQILDGRNRDEACREAGVTPTYVELPEGQDPLQFVLDRNLHRRHLTVGQRALLGERLATMPHGGNRRRVDHDDQFANLRLEDAARLVGVSSRALSMARDLVEAEDEELIDRVRTGRLSLNAADILRTRYRSDEASDEELEEQAEDIRVSRRRAFQDRFGNPRRRGQSNRSAEERAELTLEQLYRLATHDSQDLVRFRQALGRFRVAPEAGTAIQHLRTLISRLDRHIEHTGRAKAKIEVFLGLKKAEPE